MSNFVEILKHGRNYMFASFATKALVFISIPIYTRLMSSEEYGIVSIFIGTVTLLNSIFTLNCDTAVSRYYFDKKNDDDFKEFVGSSVIFSGTIFIINSILVIIFAGKIANYVNIPEKTVYLIIPTVLLNITGLTFEQIYGPRKASGKIAKLSIFKVSLNCFFSILLILLFKNNKYYGQIIGSIIAGSIIAIFWIRGVVQFVKPVLRKEHIKYILIFAVPLIPYILSGAIIEQFAKIAIGKDLTLSNAGYYSLALSFAGLTGIAITVAHQAWNPYYFEYMNTGQYEAIDKDLLRIFQLTIIVAAGIAAFSNEIGLLLIKKEFMEYFNLIPILVLGYVFYQLAYIYMRNFGYYKKTIYSTITVFISGGINIILNLYTIPRYGAFGASLSFVISYVSMALIAWVFSKYVIKCYCTSIIKIMKPTLLMIIFSFIVFIRFSNDYLSYFFIRFGLYMLLTCIMLWNERKNIKHIAIIFINKIPIKK